MKFPGNKKRDGVCVYYRKDLPTKRHDDLSNLDECLVLEIAIKRSQCFVICIYCSLSDSREEMYVVRSLNPSMQK